MNMAYNVIGAVGYHKLKLRDPHQAEAFENFAINELLPKYNSVFEGKKMMLAKADRGEEKGNYTLLLLFDSKERRDSYYPEPNGNVSDEVKMLWDSPEIKSVTEKLNNFAEREFVSDFEILNNEPALSETI